MPYLSSQKLRLSKKEFSQRVEIPFFVGKDPTGF
jgi:hypothetical protein